MYNNSNNNDVSLWFILINKDFILILYLNLYLYKSL